MFVDDAEAYDAYIREEEPEEETVGASGSSQPVMMPALPCVITTFFSSLEILTPNYLLHVIWQTQGLKAIISEQDEQMFVDDDDELDLDELDELESKIRDTSLDDNS